ncbi:cAMP receptor (Car4), putative [Talaromyces stipitatus ATCC 10500]|uniref:cAMP receptor (Car4), putative n=1 Tax=Talaromyces stipitatus (strain ATCC 10500 / CBS 375.48 / QM 6759 / NRRL 1006) TaxID=441959 RepID=B8MRG1_TALSN|nr:cAMP receptor (Car4), putative [Talaromyces stipitatus ATCC 10500]EED13098.1 cAMP receptor (Car4), putative [Talaromyces stipitatus ATCC 10500]
MISTSGPDAGNSSALCQFQGFCLQMFPMADVLWTVAMAVDVYLVVYHRFEAEALRKLEIYYITIITGVVAIPALVFLFIHTLDKGPISGAQFLLIGFSFGFCFTTGQSVLILYILVGVKVVKLRHQFNASHADHIALSSNISTKNHSFDHPSNTLAVTVEVNIRTQPSLSSHPDQKGPQSFIEQSALPSHMVLDYNHSKQSHVSFRQYILMPMVFFLVLLATWVAPTINRISAFVNPNHSSYPLMVTVGAMGSLRGFWNGVVFISIGMKSWRRQTRLQKWKLSDKVKGMAPAKPRAPR